LHEIFEKEIITKWLQKDYNFITIFKKGKAAEFFRRLMYFAQSARCIT
jgi:hypothetical protein